MSADQDKFDDAFAGVEKREAKNKKAKQKLDEAWARLVKTVGRETAKNFMFTKMGVKKPGRPDSDDEIGRCIITYLAWSQAFGSKREPVPEEIADRILASPPHKMTYRTKPGPDAYVYIDANDGREEFYADAEIDHGPVEITIDRYSLVKRVRRVMRKMIAAGELKVPPVATTTGWKADSAGVKSRTVGEV